MLDTIERIRILLTDDDAWLVRALSVVLEQRGYAVDVAHDGRDAFDRAVAQPPDLLITDALMPLLDGWTLVKLLRERAELVHLPVIFLSALSSDQDRIRGFRLGADDYVVKPFRYEELDLRITTTLRRAHAELGTARPPLPGASFTARLEDIGLSGLLVLIELERKTGRLLARGSDGIGELFARDGRIVQASITGRDDLPDVASVHHILMWRHGEVAFRAEPVDGPDRVQATTTQLLLGAAL